MRRFLLLSVLTVSLIAFGIGSAFAFSLAGGYLGPVKFKFSNYEKMYDPRDPQHPDYPDYYYNNGDGVEDNYGIFYVTGIYSADGFNTELWTPSASEELTGVFYGIDIQSMSVGAGGDLNVQSVGGWLDTYLDITPDFDASQGQSGYFDTNGIPHDEYTTATDGTLFLSTMFVPGIDSTNDATVDGDFDGGTIPSSGDAASYLSITGGAYDWMFDSDGYTPTWTDDSANSQTSIADFYEIHDFFENDGSITPIVGDWHLLSEDPLYGTAVPEPATMLLLGTGLIGLAGVGRKKKFFKKD